MVLAGGGAALALCTLALPAIAQTETDRRVDRLEKSLREVRAIVFQGKETGQPVVVRPEGPDPTVQALAGRFDDLDQTNRRLSGQVEVMQHDLDEAKKAAAQTHDAEAELRGEVKALSDRLTRLETPPAPPPAPVAEVAPAPDQPAPTRTGRRGAPPRASEATAKAQTEDRGVLGGPQEEPVAPRATEAGVYRSGRALLASGDYAGAGDAFSSYLTTYPTGPHAAESAYWLGESDYIREAWPEAISAYARALKGYPKTPWAPDAMAKLAQSLLRSGDTAKACAAASAFDQRYGAQATASLKARIAGVRTKARCTG